MAKKLLSLGFAGSLIIIGGPAAADDAEVAALREQLRSTVLQLRQLQDQQAAAQAAPSSAPDEAGLMAKLAASQRELAAVRRGAAATTALKAALASAQSENAALSSASAASAAELERYKASYNQAAETVRELTAERDRLKARVDMTSNIAAVCATKNVRLVAFSEGLLTAYQKIGFAQVLSAREPVLGLWRVRLQNIAQDREDTVRADRCNAPQDASANSVPAPERR
ncbi:MAG: hypothetical protein JO127_04515 [Caulobacteraceae bacterium]|nr:hypothetical protein [Caulobacteraceae bacterium]